MGAFATHLPASLSVDDLTGVLSSYSNNRTNYERSFLRLLRVALSLHVACQGARGESLHCADTSEPMPACVTSLDTALTLG